MHCVAKWEVTTRRGAARVAPCSRGSRIPTDRGGDSRDGAILLRCTLVIPVHMVDGRKEKRGMAKGETLVCPSNWCGSN